MTGYGFIYILFVVLRLIPLQISGTWMEYECFSCKEEMKQIESVTSEEREKAKRNGIITHF